MPGVQVELFSKRAWDFSALAATGKCTLVIASAVPVARWVEGVFLVRLHSRSIASGASVRIRLFTCAPSPEAPQTEWVVPASPAADILLDSTSPLAPALLQTPLSAAFGAALQVQMLATQAGTPGLIQCELSGTLILKMGPIA